MVAPLQKFRKSVADILEITAISFRASPFLLFTLIGIQILLGLRPVVSAWVIKRLVDVLATNVQGDIIGALLENMWFLLILQGIVITSGKFLLDIQAYCRGELGRRLELVTRTMIFTELNRFDGIRYFETPAFYNKIDTASRGLSEGPPWVVFHLSELFQSVVTLVSFVGILMVFSPLLALLVVLASLPQLIGRLWMSGLNYQTYQKKRPKERRKGYLSSMLSHRGLMKDVRAFNLSEHLLGEFLETTGDIHELDRANGLKQLRIKSGLNLLVGSLASSTFGIVVWQALQRLITVGDVTFYFSALIGVMNALNVIADKISILNAYTLYFDQYKQLKDLPNDITTPDNPKRVPNLQRGVTLKDISFQYQENSQPVLRNLSLTIPAGKTLALVGANAAGKTTLVKLLTRLYEPDAGQILWDDVDVREFSAPSLRKHIATIFQDFARYDLTVGENIALGNATETQNFRWIEESAQKAGVDETVHKLPAGYNTILSYHIVDDDSNGMDVSGGEWQKIALARLHMRDADFVILDEPSADLDAQAEREIYEQFLAHKGDKTALLISGRFSTIRMADAIAVMKEGAIVEYGTHEELIVKNGEYARLYHSQAEQYQ